MTVPQPLVRAITAGDCVAFVGAGFSAPVIPQWRQLIADLSRPPLMTNPTLEGRIASLLEGGTGRDLEAAAQTLRDAIGEEAFGAALRDRLGDPPRNAVMRRRLELLNSIPFRAILTTNFDGLLQGMTPGREAYLGVLRPSGHRWFDRRYWHAARPGAAVVKLHGSIDLPDGVVFTQRDYRRRLYESPGYATFLRAVMSTTTVLYLGFSFTDAYLNELRSEILSLLDHRGGDEPVAYAVVADATEAEAAYSLEHEGLHVLSYATGDGGDHSGFDAFLAEIHRLTDPRQLLGRILSGKRILWVDPSVTSNVFGMGFLEAAATEAGGSTAIDEVASVEAALAEIETGGADLVVTRWGHGSGPDGQSSAEHLLGQIRARNLPAPVIVFASGEHADENKVRAMRLGATSYESTWEGLFQEIARVLRPGSYAAR